MSSTLTGAKSKLYLNRDQIPGYTAEQSNDSLQHVTAQEIAGQRVGMDVVIHGKYPVVASIAVAAGSVRRVIKLTAHGLQDKKGYFLKPLNGNAEGEEVAILSVPDANTVIIAAEINMAIGDLVEIFRHVTPNYTEEGDLNVVVSGSGPVQFEKNGVTTTVSYDTATPSNSEALPVNIVTVNGQGISTTVDLSGAQINVQLSDRGTSPDSVLIGDGADYLAINADGSINAVVPATETEPLGIRETDGVNFLSSIALAAAQLTTGALTKIKATMGIMMGWDGTTHRELSVTSFGVLRTIVTPSSTASLVHATVAVGTSAVRLTTDGAAPTSTRRRLKFFIDAETSGAAKFYIGSSTVTTSGATKGIRVFPDAMYAFDDNDMYDWYIVSDTAAQEVNIAEVK